MKIRTVGQRVLLEPVKAETTTASGLYMPTSDRRTTEGIIVEAEALSLAPGTRVIFNGGRPVGSTGLLVVEVDDVLAVYEGG